MCFIIYRPQTAHRPSSSHSCPSEMQRETDMLLVRRKYKRYSKQKMTYLGLIACVIQNAHQKKLTFHELMNAVKTFVDGDRKGIENNIKICLSSNSCFVKVPVNPECPNGNATSGKWMTVKSPQRYCGDTSAVCATSSQTLVKPWKVHHLRLRRKTGRPANTPREKRSSPARFP
ncbi:forkhead box protein H1-like [Carassius auratus]|uniref:Forkhead box protein H1-like n=1 Tax=Carassius auratus TaxID=7957 RepID=A0A6P6NUF0_CARAU|nr:forkhead box protein H1-like [Carassius auratus]